MREGDPWGDYDGGIMPDDMRGQVRDRWRASGLPQDPHRSPGRYRYPQLANALQGRSAYRLTRLPDRGPWWCRCP